MNSLFTISADQHGYFSTFYLLAFLLAILFMYYEGYRRKFSLSSWLLIIFTGILFFLIGTKLFTYSLEQLESIISNQYLVNQGRKTILGGILGGLFGFTLAKRWLNFKEPVLDLIAIILPLVMALQRIGCLMGGCCHGKPTNMPWGITYGEGTIAYKLHLSSGLINSHDTTSLVIHPTQLYQILGCLLIALVVWKFRNYWKAQGSLVMFSIGLYALLRFCSEFFRDPHADGLFGNLVFGLKSVQWYLMAGIILISICILFKERLKGNKEIHIDNIEVGFMRKSSLLFMSSTLLLIEWSWFEINERIVLLLVFIPALIIFAWLLYKKVSIYGFRWIPLLPLIGGILLMSQTYVPEKGEKKQYTTISIGTIFGKYTDEYKEVVGSRTETRPSSCGGYYDVQVPILASRYNEYKYWLGGLQVKQTYCQSKYQKLILGSSFFLGKLSNSNSYYNTIKEKGTFAINPFIHFDSRWVGVGVGASIGDIYYFQNESEESVNIAYANYFPQLHVRFFPREACYLFFDYGNHFPSCFPADKFKIGLGSEFGTTNGTNFSCGWSQSGVMFNGSIPIKRFIIEPYLAVGVKKAACMSISLHYRFNVKTKNITAQSE